jgi:hypothetical protein
VTIASEFISDSKDEMEGKKSNDKFEDCLKLCREISVPESSCGEDNLEDKNYVLN